MIEAVFDGEGRRLDQIQIQRISAHGYHGVYEEERTAGQVFDVDVVLHLDGRPAARSDSLDQTVNYAEIAEHVRSIVEGPSVNLLETLASRIAAAVFADGRVLAADVEVHKPNAPIPVRFGDVSCAIRRFADEDLSEFLTIPGLAAAPMDPAPEPLLPVRPAPPVEVAPIGRDRVMPDLAPEPEPLLSEPAPVYTASALDEIPTVPATAVLALGANLGPTQQTLRQAVVELDRSEGIRVQAIAPLARTAPVGEADQPLYLNTVVQVSTNLSPRELLQACMEIEARHGRERSEPNAPRTLDIDIITYNDVEEIAEDLELPHPRAFERAFVLVPWSEMDPDAVLPGFGGGHVAELAAHAKDRDGVRYMALDWFDESALDIDASMDVELSEPMAAEPLDQGYPVDVDAQGYPLGGVESGYPADVRDHGGYPVEGAYRPVRSEADADRIADAYSMVDEFLPGDDGYTPESGYPADASRRGMDPGYQEPVRPAFPAEDYSSPDSYRDDRAGYDSGPQPYQDQRYPSGPVPRVSAVEAFASDRVPRPERSVDDRGPADGLPRRSTRTSSGPVGYEPGGAERQGPRVGERTPAQPTALGASARLAQSAAVPRTVPPADLDRPVEPRPISRAIPVSVSGTVRRPPMPGFDEMLVEEADGIGGEPQGSEPPRSPIFGSLEGGSTDGIPLFPPVHTQGSAGSDR